MLESAVPLRAQDPFEIHVYEYETLAPRHFTLETHLNFVGIGTNAPEGTGVPRPIISSMQPLS